MTTVANSLKTTPASNLVVNREDIEFCNITPEIVRIEVTVHNDGPETSAATIMELSSAPLGAFVPWRPLTKVAVPPIPPGAKTTLHIDASRQPVRHLAESSKDEYGRRRRSSLGDELREKLVWHQLATRLPRLAREVFDSRRRGNFHWAGNINVFIGKKSVERHRALALRVYPGRNNRALFFVGSKPDAYMFQLNGSFSEFARLSAGRSLRARTIKATDAISSDDWIESERGLRVNLDLCLPEECEQGKLDVHIRQRSTGDHAVVELDLDPRGEGPGCYRV